MGNKAYRVINGTREAEPVFAKEEKLIEYPEGQKPQYICGGIINGCICGADVELVSVNSTKQAAQFRLKRNPSKRHHPLCKYNKESKALRSRLLSKDTRDTDFNKLFERVERYVEPQKKKNDASKKMLESKRYVNNKSYQEYEDDRPHVTVYRGGHSLLEVYAVSAINDPNSYYKSGERVSDVFVNYRNIMDFRTDRELKGCVLVLAEKSPDKEINAMLMKNCRNENEMVWTVRDPFKTVHKLEGQIKEYPPKIYYVLSFTDDEVLESVKKILNNPADDMAMFLVFCRWIDLGFINGVRVAKGRISKAQQVEPLPKEYICEDIEMLARRRR